MCLLWFCVLAFFLACVAFRSLFSETLLDVCSISSILFCTKQSKNIHSVFQLQRLKRSLSLKSVIRSKSVDNFFQRSNGESRPASAIITAPPPPSSPPPFSESPLGYERSPSLSPSVSPNPSLSSHSPSISPSLSRTLKSQLKSQPMQPVKTHCFQERVFRRPTSCQRCKHMIQGRSISNLLSNLLSYWLNRKVLFICCVFRKFQARAAL